jgi:hypothetical protein
VASKGFAGELEGTPKVWGAVLENVPVARFPRDLGCPQATRSPASNKIGSRQSLDAQGFGERSGVFFYSVIMLCFLKAPMV